MLYTVYLCGLLWATSMDLVAAFALTTENDNVTLECEKD